MMVNTAADLCLKVLDNEFARLQNRVRLATNNDRQTLIFRQAHLYAHS